LAAHHKTARETFLPRIKRTEYFLAPAKRPSKFEILMGLVESAKIQFFHDQFQFPWGAMRINGHCENIRVQDRLFRNHLFRMFYSETGDVCGREVLRQAQELCTAIALHESECRHLSCRTAWADDRILVDLGTDDWSAIEITASGYKIVHLDQPPFKRYPHMRPLPFPEKGGQIKDFVQIFPTKDANS
jgi:hypothetical protein